MVLRFVSGQLTACFLCVFLMVGPVWAESQRAIEARTTGGVITWSAENGRLRQVLEAFPKGGDIHNHLMGAVYAESWLDWAAEDGLCADLSVPALKMKEKESCAASGWMTAEAARADETARRGIINGLSLRSFVPESGWSGHDQFFSTFSRIAYLPSRQGDQLAQVADRAGKQNILYLELMHTIILPELFPLVGGMQLSGDVAKDYATLMNSPFGKKMPELVASARKQIAEAEEKKNRLLGCGTAMAAPGCDVEIRFLHQVVREFSPAMVYAQFILGWALMDAEPLMVGMNLVAPEDGFIALRDYTLHMQMIDHLYSKLGPQNISLHAGELTLGLVRPHQLEFHIREAIELGHAKRIGHGIDIVYEKGSAQLLDKMAKEGILVEINLTSNDVILGVKGKQHPALLYRDMEVPYTLSTDDEGVSRIDLTHEYMRYWNDYNVTYFELRHISRNALTHSFLPGGSLWDEPACVADVEAGQEASKACRALIRASEKAALQWKLEEKLRAFEGEQRIPRRKLTSFK